jgi:Cu/Ag efflux protein CusF
MRWIYAVVIVAVCGVVWFAWHSATTAQVKRYPLTGTVIALHPESQTATVHNENMPGVMEPMNMDYQVKNAQTFSQLKEGQKIRATLVTDRQSSWQLEDIQISASK